MRFQARRLLTTMSSFGGGGGARSKVTGLAPGPFGVGVTTVQFEDRSRDDGGACRKLQTEIWYPAAPASGPPNRYRDFLGAATPEIIAAAEKPDAIGGYAEGLTIAALDASWPQSAMRDAPPLPTAAPWPAVRALHAQRRRGRDARRPAVEAGEDGARRVADVFAVLDGLEGLARTDSRFAGRVDARNAAVTGMSFGGWTAAAALERGDARRRASSCARPSRRPTAALAAGHGATAPALVMIGTEDTVIGEEGNAAARRYAADHGGPAALLEIVRGGHVSFTSCELYTPTYGNGIGPPATPTAPPTSSGTTNDAEVNTEVKCDIL
ncbi:platelet-activating factor acetylhydrolase [Aureococcus anophagefferens]|nr:platelet-activating factor acetylhydrolase [Aureococcus anophagefferens]